MIPSPGGNRRILLTFALGITIGFAFTYMFFFTVNQSSLTTSPIPSHSHQFIPKSPHSHGETDDFVGPDREQNWHDFDAENHHDEDEVAQYLKEKVRLLCWVMTSPSNLQTKARHVKATWGKRCNVLLFMSSQPDPSLPAIGLDMVEGRDFLWGKTRKAFEYIYKNHFHEADWFLKADDDTYVVVENLRHMLHEHNPMLPTFFGRRFKPYVKQGYMSGGAGYVLSKEAVRKFVTEALPDWHKCRPDPGGAEDLEMGQCMENVGVYAGDSRDSQGRERFHPFVPEHHLIPGLIPRDNWYWEYNYFPAKEGPECCSDYAVTFHYVPPNMMYVFEYLIYHLKPYGISSKLVLPLADVAADKYKSPKNINTAAEKHAHDNQLNVQADDKQSYDKETKQFSNVDRKNFEDRQTNEILQADNETPILKHKPTTRQPMLGKVLMKNHMGQNS